MGDRWIRSQRAAVADSGADLLLVGRDGSVRKLDGDSAELARVVIGALARPCSEHDVIAHVESLAGPLGERRSVVRDVMKLLADTGAIGRAGSATAAEVAVTSGGGGNVVLGISGAIAATHAPALLSALQRRGYTVEVAMTQTAQRFVSVDALGAIAGREIHTSLWPATPHAPAPHVALALWADFVIVYPASATTIGRIANGDFSDLVSAIALTTRAPLVLAPSMNLAMLEAAAVERNFEKLQADGAIVLHGVPSQEVAEAPATRTTWTGAAAAPGEVAATIDALRTAGVLRHVRVVGDPSSWDAIYRAVAGGVARSDGLPLAPWVADACDDDIAALIGGSGGGRGGGRRLLDIGTGLGQVARYAAERGYRVTATDISEVGLRLARDRAARELDIVWLRDDICASSLINAYDVIVDRATLHTLSRSRVHAWAATVQRLLAPGGRLVVKTHREGVPNVTSGWTPDAITTLLPQLELVSASDAELPGITGPAPVASVLAQFQRR